MFKACYGKTGYSNIAFERATKQGVKNDAKEIYDWITTLPLNHKIRHFVVGDLCIDGKNIDKKFVAAVKKAHTERPDVRAFGFTHAWRSFSKNPFDGVDSLNFNASVENGKGARRAKRLGFDVVMVVPETTPIGRSIVDGVKVLLCPNQAAEQLIEEGKAAVSVTCDKCMLCAKKNRNEIIGFRVHGSLKKNSPVK